MSSSKLSKLIEFNTDIWLTKVINKSVALQNRYKLKKLILTEGLSGSGTIIELGKHDDVEISLTIDPSKHTHTKDQLPVSVPAVPETIALRNSSGDIQSSGAISGASGYKLANGTDLTSLFKTTNSTYISVGHTTTGSGSACTGAALAIVGNKLVLTTNWAAYCSYWAYCRCQCCC